MGLTGDHVAGQGDHVGDHNLLDQVIAAKALDSEVVHNTGVETVGGDKTFTGKVTGNAGLFDGTARVYSDGNKPPQDARLQYGVVVPWPADASGAYGTRTRPPGVVWAFSGPYDPGARMDTEGDSYVKTPS